MSRMSEQAQMSSGEILYPDLDFGTLLKEFAKLPPNLDEQLSFFVENARGAAAIGHIAAFEEKHPLLSGARQSISRIFDRPENGDKTGAQLGLVNVPALFASDPLVSLWLSSSVLTPNIIRDTIRNAKATGGATYSILFQYACGREGNPVAVHAEGVVVPDEEADGRALAFSVMHAPYEEGSDNAKIILKEVLGCAQFGPAEPTSALSKAFNTPSDNMLLAPRNMVVIPRERDFVVTLGELLAANKESRPSRVPNHPYKRVPFTTEVVFSWKIDAAGLSTCLALENLQKISAAAGESLTLGSHYGCTSCEHFVVQVLRYIRPELFADIDLCLLPLQELTPKIVPSAEEVFLAKQPSKYRIYDFVDPGRRNKCFDEVTGDPKSAIKSLNEALRHSSLNTLTVPGLASWQNTFNNFTAVHPDPNARQLFLFAAMVTARVLRVIANA